MSSPEQLVNPVNAGTASYNLRVDLAAPEVPEILKDEDDVESPDGLLPRAVLNRDLEVTIPWWLPTVAQDPPYIIIVSWVSQGGPFTEVSRFTFDNPTPDDKTVTVPQDKLEHGVYDLSYELSYGGNTTSSLKKKVTVDRVPPEDNQEPQPLVRQGFTGDITDEFLNEHGEARFSVPVYLDLKARDRAICYWADIDPPPGTEPDIGEQVFYQADIDARRLIITVPEAVIRAKGHGQRYVYYRLQDWAGNRGVGNSTLLPIFVDLTPAPGALKPPRVPLSARGLIDRQHAREGAVDQRGVTVEIDPYDNADSADKVLISWNGTELDPLDVEPGKTLTAYVPWEKLTDNGLGPLNARVVYRVRRGSGDTPPSPVTMVPVNLTIAGQDHVEAPALLNKTLARVEVLGAISKIPNTLLGVDHGHPATATVALYQTPVARQMLYLYWGAIRTPVAEYEVKPGDAVGDEVPFTIPWSVIDMDKDNPALPVYYTTSNGVNEQLSPTTPVLVAIELIDGLKEPSFPHANLWGYLNCCAVPRLWEGVWVKIDGNPAFDAGDTVRLIWQGCYNLNGTAAIRGVRFAFPKVLNAQEAREGFEIHIADYERLIAPMVDNGSGLAYYTLIKTTGAVGTSSPDFVKITRTMASGKVCSPFNDLCNE